MSKNVYLIQTDLHMDFSKANRLDYFGEILQSMQDILTIAGKYHSEGYSVKLMLLGDVFDGALTNSSDAMQAMELFRYYTSNFDNTWSVVGNHEISYARDNPFWFLVSVVEDDSLQVIRRFIQPRGMNNTIVVPNIVQDGEVTFYFNHFGISAKTPATVGIKIGLFHQNVGSNDICQMWGTFDNVEEAAYIQGYNYCFFGHMHLAKGKYYLNESKTCLCEWLGTIGRTKVTEVLEEDLKVNIPAVIVEDGKLKGIEDNYIQLQSPQKCIDYIKLKAYEQSKKIVEERKGVVENTFKGASLFETMEGVLEGTPLAFLLHFLDDPWDKILDNYNNTLYNPAGSEEGEES